MSFFIIYGKIVVKLKIYLKGAKIMFENAKVALNYKENGKTVSFSGNN